MKSYFLFFLTVIIALSLNAQQKKLFKLNVKLSDTSIKKIELLYISKDTNFKVDKKVIYPVSEIITFSGALPYVYAAYLRFNDTIRSQMFFIEPNRNQQVSIISINKPIKLLNSPLTDEYENSFLPQFTYIDFKIDSFYRVFRTFNSNPDSAVVKKEKIRDEVNLLKVTKKKILRQYIKNKPSSYISLWALYFEVMVRGYHPTLKDAFCLLPENFQDNPIGNEIKRNLENSFDLTTGKFFPVLKLKDTTNQWAELLITKKFTLVDFWFSTCGPCIAQFNQLKSIYSKNVGRGFEIIGVSIDADLNLWKNSIRENKLNWVQFLDQKGLETSRMSINAFPTNFLIDKNGKIVQKNITIVELNRLLDRELCY